MPFACIPSCPLASGVAPFFVTECRELVRTGVNGLSALRFCGITERGGVLTCSCCGCGASVAEMMSSFAVTSRSGWNSWYGRSSRGFKAWLDRGMFPGRKWPDSSRAKEPGLLLCRPGRLAELRGAIENGLALLELWRTWLCRIALLIAKS